MTTVAVSEQFAATLAQCDEWSREREHAAAERVAQMCVTQHPHAPDAFAILGHVRLCAGDSEGALQAFVSAQALDCDYIGCHVAAAQAHINLTQYTHALALYYDAFEDIISSPHETHEEEERFASAEVFISGCLSQMGRAREAEERLCNVVATRRHPWTYEVGIGVAMQLHLAGCYQQVIDVVGALFDQKIMDAQPIAERSFAWFVLGTAYHDMGRTEQSHVCHARSIELDVGPLPTERLQMSEGAFELMARTALLALGSDCAALIARCGMSVRVLPGAPTIEDVRAFDISPRAFVTVRSTKFFAPRATPRVIDLLREFAHRKNPSREIVVWQRNAERDALPLETVQRSIVEQATKEMEAWEAENL